MGSASVGKVGLPGHCLVRHKGLKYKLNTPKHGSPLVKEKSIKTMEGRCHIINIDPIKYGLLLLGTVKLNW